MTEQPVTPPAPGSGKTSRIVFLLASLLAIGAAGGWFWSQSATPVEEPAAPALLATPPVQAQPVKNEQPNAQLPGTPIRYADFHARIKNAQKQLENYPQYTATFTRQEREGKKLNEMESMQMKLRHEPFSVYIYYTVPKGVKGRQAIYVKGKNDDKIVAHDVGLKRYLGTIKLKITEDRRIDHSGIKYFTEQIANQHIRSPEYLKCQVYQLKPEKVGGRMCDVFLIANGKPIGDFRLAQSRIWIDQEWQVPVRLEGWDWTEKDPGKMELDKHYLYTDINWNAPLTDRDFDHTNPAYNYP